MTNPLAIADPARLVLRLADGESAGRPEELELARAVMDVLNLTDAYPGPREWLDVVAGMASHPDRRPILEGILGLAGAAGASLARQVLAATTCVACRRGQHRDCRGATDVSPGPTLYRVVCECAADNHDDSLDGIASVGAHYAEVVEEVDERGNRYGVAVEVDDLDEYGTPHGIARLDEPPPDPRLLAYAEEVDDHGVRPEAVRRHVGADEWLGRGQASPL